MIKKEEIFIKALNQYLESIGMGPAQRGDYPIESIGGSEKIVGMGGLEKLAFCRDLSYDRSMSMSIRENIYNPKSSKEISSDIDQYFKNNSLIIFIFSLIFFVWCDANYFFFIFKN